MSKLHFKWKTIAFGVLLSGVICATVGLAVIAYGDSQTENQPAVEGSSVPTGPSLETVPVTSQEPSVGEKSRLVKRISKRVPKEDAKASSERLLALKEVFLQYHEGLKNSVRTLEDEFYGVLTYRGSEFRDQPHYNMEIERAETLSLKWKFKMSAYSKTWGSGSGWTGQPLIVHWTREQKALMGFKEPYLSDENFVELITGSLDGHIYFLSTKDGKETRKPIDIGNPIKGTLSLHSGGLPLLYVGNGIPDQAPFGLRLYNLITMKEVYFVTDHPKAWNAFDSSALFIPEEGRMVVAGENGLFYELTLNSSLVKNQLIIKPKLRTLRLKAGAESSVSRGEVDGRWYYFCSDNHGNFYKIDAETLKIKWQMSLGDDADATPVLAEETINGHQVLVAYAGTEVDRQGKNGLARLFKIDLSHEKVLWQKGYPAISSGEGLAKSDGGIITPVLLGKGQAKSTVFIGVNRWHSKEGGTLVALDRATGKLLWQKELNTRFWSAMTGVTDQLGAFRIIVTTRDGQLSLIDGKTAKVLDVEKRNSYTESSLSGMGNLVFSTTRTGYIYCYEIQ